MFRLVVRVGFVGVLVFLVVRGIEKGWFEGLRGSSGAERVPTLEEVELPIRTQPPKKVTPKPAPVRRAPAARTPQPVERSAPRQPAAPPGRELYLLAREGPDCVLNFVVPSRRQVEITYLGGKLLWFDNEVLVGNAKWNSFNVMMRPGEKLAYDRRRVCRLLNVCVLLRYKRGSEERQIVEEFPMKFGPPIVGTKLVLRNWDEDPARVCLDTNIKTHFQPRRDDPTIREDGRSWLTGSLLFRVRVI